MKINKKYLVIISIFLIMIFLSPIIGFSWTGPIDDWIRPPGDKRLTGTKYGLNDKSNAIRIYVVKQTGNNVKVVSAVKDFRSSVVSKEGHITHYSVSANGLGTRINGDSRLVSDGNYKKYVETKSSYFDKALPKVFVDGGTQDVKKFIIDLYADEGNCKPNCLSEFLINVLGGMDATTKSDFRNLNNFSSYFIIVEPVHYYWRISGAPDAIAFSSTDGALYYNNFGTALSDVRTRIYNMAPLAIMNVDIHQQLSVLDRVTMPPLKPAIYDPDVCYSACFYTKDEMIGRSGYGIGYFYMNDFVEKIPPDDTPKTCQTMINQFPNATEYWKFVEEYLNKTSERYQGDKFNCCTDFDNYIKSIEKTKPESKIIISYKTDYELYCKSNVTPPTPIPEDPDGKECRYSVAVSCPDCTENQSGIIKDIDDWDCIFASDKVASVPFKNHYNSNLNNRYCKVYCREEMGYVYPKETFTVYAGSHFTMGDFPSDSSTLVPNWGSVAFQGTANCRPSTDRDLKTDKLAGDHDYLNIDHVLFAKDWKELNQKLGDAWDKYQVAVLQDWAKSNAKFDGKTCGLVFDDSYSNKDGCVNEEKMYKCPQGVPVDRGTDPRNTEFKCTYTTDAKEVSGRYECLSGVLEGSLCRHQVDAIYSHYRCLGTSNAKYEKVKTPKYEYAKANIRGNESSGSFSWCTGRNDVTYSWEDDYGSAGYHRRYVIDSQVTSLRTSTELYRNAASTLPSNLITSPTVEDSKKLYDDYYNQLENRLLQIRACQSFEYSYDHLSPKMLVGYKDYKYPEPKEFELDLVVTEQKDTDYLLKGKKVDYSTADIDRFVCATPISPGRTESLLMVGRAFNCPVEKQEYPNNDSFYHTKDRVINYELNKDVYRYVVKHSEKGKFTFDSVSYHQKPSSGNFIDIGYGNFPIHYYQGENYPSTSTVWLRLANSPSESFGFNNRFDKFVFGMYKPAFVDSECMRYECDYNIKYRIIPPDDGGPTETIDILVKFRPIDLVEPFPGNDGLGRMPGWNWQGDHVIESVIVNNRGVSGSRVYFDVDPMYTINLNFSNIFEIRGYNRGRDYFDFNLNCRTGLTSEGRHRECQSSFVDQFVTRNSCLLNSWDGCHNL